MATRRFMLIALVLASAAVAVSADEEPMEDVDRTDFSDPSLQEDKVASDPHPEVESAWIFPEAEESKIPIGGVTDLLIALANGGAKMFNVSHVQGELQSASEVVTLPRFEYGQPLGPSEERSFRMPLNLSDTQALGEYTLVAEIFYNTRDKEPYVTTVLNETVELVPPRANGDAQLRMLQLAFGFAGVLVLALIGARSMLAGADGKGKGKASKGGGGDAPAAVAGNEWLAGTLAGTEGRQPKKTKRG